MVDRAWNDRVGARPRQIRRRARVCAQDERPDADAAAARALPAVLPGPPIFACDQASRAGVPQTQRYRRIAELGSAALLRRNPEVLQGTFISNADGIFVSFGRDSWRFQNRTSVQAHAMRK